MTDATKQACQLYRQLHAQSPNIVALSDDGLVRIVGDDIACIATALADRARAVWEAAAKYWGSNPPYNKLALGFPSDAYPKWGDVFAAWCRQQAGGEAVRWTSEKPTVPGWYWFKQDIMRDGELSDSFIMYINHLGEACESGSTTRHSVHTLCPHWAGPIPAPGGDDDE